MTYPPYANNQHLFMHSMHTYIKERITSKTKSAFAIISIFLRDFFFFLIANGTNTGKTTVKPKPKTTIKLEINEALID